MSQGAVVPAPVAKALADAQRSVTAIVKVPKAKRNFANTLGAIDDISAELDTATSLIYFQQYVSTDAKERDAGRAAQEAVSNFLIALSRREDLYKVVRDYAATKPKLKGEQARLLEFTLRDYRRAGMSLPKAKRDRLAAIEKRLQKIGTEYERNIYEDESIVPLRPEDLKGVPEEALAEVPRANGLLLLKPDGPLFDRILDTCENADTRQRVWTVFKRRGGIKNVALLEEAIRLRSEMSALLGYANLVEYATEPRMAKNAATVAKFFDELRPVVRRKASLDYGEFLEAKHADTGSAGAPLYSWDYSFYKNKLLRERYAVDNQKIAEFFPVQQVFDGLFQVASRIYGITFKDVTSSAKSLGLPVWHADVRLWEVTDQATKKTLGHLYTDLFPRPNKYDHAACWGLRPRKVWANGKVQLPLAALVCNFTKPTADKPALMQHPEVVTFFHEFGHGLHNLLTETSYARFSGTSVSQDFAEAPSQMFENWVWEPSVLQLFAKHHQSGEPLPAETLQSMQRAQTLGSGLETEHQIYYALVDQRYHTAPGGKVDTTKVGIDMLPEIELYPRPEGTYYQASFGHFMGYEGSYYSYIWSLVYAQDMYERFREKGPLDPGVGMDYRKKVLSRGGSMDEFAMLRDFLGREPRAEAFRRHLGLN